ncbi:hypothetical protein CFAM422_001644 [Trichoderma lentiforme]|uniref:Protein kinase domain-containing protein n=1 Tax=Trichoderma lentiforme TaxID=1567552 RepID=A0A9P5CG63_9HYPO|nr:hypothetical protein CFAM422_001644 [Trichoderma lentiforme]
MAAPRYEIENAVTSIREDDNDARFTVRRNGKVFYIKLSPSNFVNSPNMTNKYRSYLEVLKSDQEVLVTTCANRGVALLAIPVRFDDDFLDDLETWTSLYDPANIVISHKAPKDALFKAPKKVLIDNGQTVCFFKRCYDSIQITQELKTYKKIHEAGLDSRLNLGTTLSAMHENHIIWGDVKAENVLIDENEDAWLVDFGGGYTEGWVDKEVAGTVMGDFTSMAKLRTLLFPTK